MSRAWRRSQRVRPVANSTRPDDTILEFLENAFPDEDAERLLRWVRKTLDEQVRTQRLLVH